MWNFYLDESEAMEKAGNSALIEITLKEGHDLDNIRRQEMGFERISLHAFKRILLDDIFPSET